ncbi:MAG: hypothetical protein PHI49_05380, partial [Halothiobacillaceae bacterium]|nr:hypothetical protein [Halothiobacillaceae bacterium]
TLDKDMPILSMFYGIIIRLYLLDAIDIARRLGRRERLRLLLARVQRSAHSTGSDGCENFSSPPCLNGCPLAVRMTTR